MMVTPVGAISPLRASYPSACLPWVKAQSIWTSGGGGASGVVPFLEVSLLELVSATSRLLSLPVDILCFSAFGRHEEVGLAAWGRGAATITRGKPFSSVPSFSLGGVVFVGGGAWSLQEVGVALC